MKKSRLNWTACLAGLTAMISMGAMSCSSSPSKTDRDEVVENPSTASAPTAPSNSDLPSASGAVTSSDLSTDNTNLPASNKPKNGYNRQNLNSSASDTLGTSQSATGDVALNSDRDSGTTSLGGSSSGRSR